MLLASHCCETLFRMDLVTKIDYGKFDNTNGIYGILRYLLNEDYITNKQKGN